MTTSMPVDASCAICGLPASQGECPHEAERLEIAYSQAMQRWGGMAIMREWVLRHSRNMVIRTFLELKAARLQTHNSYLHSLPCYALYAQYKGNPPLAANQLHFLKVHIANADQAYRHGIDEDWRHSCLKYPDILNYYFSLVEMTTPPDDDPQVTHPRVPTGKDTAVTARRRKSIDTEGGKVRRKERRTPPPPSPRPGRRERERF